MLPDTKVTEHLSRATAREEQRDLVEQKRNQQISLVRESRQQQLALLKTNREHGEQTLAGMVGVHAAGGSIGGGFDRRADDVAECSRATIRNRPAAGLGKADRPDRVSVSAQSGAGRCSGGACACLLSLLAYSMISGSAGSLSSQYDLTLFRPAALLMLVTVLGAPIVTSMASYLPMLSAVAQDPARVLTEN